MQSLQKNFGRDVKKKDNYDMHVSSELQVQIPRLVKNRFGYQKSSSINY